MKERKEKQRNKYSTRERKRKPGKKYTNTERRVKKKEQMKEKILNLGKTIRSEKGRRK
jgi:hypothetical protein